MNLGSSKLSDIDKDLKPDKLQVLSFELFEQLRQGPRNEEYHARIETTLPSMALTKEEVEQTLQDLTKKETFISVTPTASALASKAHRIPKRHEDVSSKKSTDTNKNIISEAHVEKLVALVRQDFAKEVRKWPQPLQDHFSAFDGMNMGSGQIHEWLYLVVVPFLMKVQESVANSPKLRMACLQIIKSIATYKSSFTPLKEVGKILLKAGLAIMSALEYGLEVAAALIVAEAAAVFALALTALLFGIGVWRADFFLVKMGCSAMIGFGIGFLFGGPGGAVAGVFVGGGAAGLMGLPPS